MNGQVSRGRFNCTSIGVVIDTESSSLLSSFGSFYKMFVVSDIALISYSCWN